MNYTPYIWQRTALTVAQLVRDGLSIEQIARRLNMTKHNVEYHIGMEGRALELTAKHEFLNSFPKELSKNMAFAAGMISEDV